MVRRGIYEHRALGLSRGEVHDGDHVANPHPDIEPRAVRRDGQPRELWIAGLTATPLGSGGNVWVAERPHRVNRQLFVFLPAHLGLADFCDFAACQCCVERLTTRLPDNPQRPRLDSGHTCHGLTLSGEYRDLVLRQHRHKCAIGRDRHILGPRCP